MKVLTAIMAMACMICLNTSAFNLPKELTRKECLREPIEKIELREGVTFFKGKYRRLFNHPDERIGCFELNILVIEWNLAKDVGLKIHINEDNTRHRPSEAMFNNPNAIACVNGFYHATVDPSTNYFPTRVNGKDYVSMVDYIDGVLAFNNFEPPAIGTGRKNGITNYMEYANFAGTDGSPDGSESAENCYPDEKSVENRLKGISPHTFIGQNEKKNMTVIIVADGYRPGQAIGANFSEVRWLMKFFGISKSICNLDSGGSSTMAIRQKVTSTRDKYPNSTNSFCRVTNYVLNDHKNYSERRVMSSIQIVIKNGN